MKPILPSRWSGIPGGGIRILPGHPLASGLIDYWLLNSCGGVVNELISGRPAVLGSGVGWSPGGGSGASFNGSATGILTPSYALPLSSANILTIAVTVYITDIATRQTLYSTTDSNDAGAVWIEIGSPLGSGITNGVVSAVNGVFVSGANSCIFNNAVNHVVYTRTGTGAGTHNIYTNGVKRTIALDTANNYTNVTDNKLIGARTSTTQRMSAGSIIQSVSIWNRALTPEEVAWLNRDPFAILIPQSPTVRYAVAPAPAVDPSPWAVPHSQPYVPKVEVVGY